MTPANPAAPSPALLAEEALRVLYRRGIEGCRMRDGHEVERVFMELIGMLNFGYREAAIRLVDVYDEGLRHLRHRQFEVPRTILETLGETLSPSPDCWRGVRRGSRGAGGDRI